LATTTAPNDSFNTPIPFDYSSKTRCNLTAKMKRQPLHSRRVAQLQVCLPGADRRGSSPQLR
jgi:hypothetical protein